MSPLPSLNYGPYTTIVFDGYEEGPSIKDNTHQRRGRNVHHVVSFTAQTELSGKKEEFLSRDTNKQRLIQMISDQLRERDCTVVNAHGNADMDIVKMAVETSLQHTTTLIGEYTDLLVLLVNYPQGEVMNLYFRSDKPKADGTIEVCHINRIQKVLGHEMCSQLMLIHAMTGSDKTSRIFGVGKNTAFQYLAKGDPVLRSCAIAFTIPTRQQSLSIT